MTDSRNARRTTPWLRGASLSALLLALGGCGGIEQGSSSTPASSSGFTNNTVDGSPGTPRAVTAADPATRLALPAFHTAPVVLEAPVPAPDADAPMSQPHQQVVPSELAGLSTRRLTWQAIDSARREGVVEPALPGDPPPMVAGSAVITYNPSQVRAAYGFATLGTAGTQGAATPAQLGAGQTIYLVDAYDDPNAAAELAAFNQNFGLPNCASVVIPTGAALPLGTASSSSCALSVVYATSAGTMTATEPQYNPMWATETALDVQWAHATAPLARIVLIEAPDASLASLSGAIALANKMGPGIVSMSWGSPEGNYTANYEPSFSVANMTYVAAAGDSGAAVNWPAVSPHVIAVGGTTLTWNGTGSRSEVAWSGTGGGLSQYTPAPNYQSSAVPGMQRNTNRAVTDVSLNADPATGEYVAVLVPGTTTVNWLAVGGTSLGAPQWAGALAVANALRTQRQLPLVGAPHALLYTQISANSGAYANAFLDVTQGTDGTCASCGAKSGYDLPTGLGTPNVAALLAALTDTAAPTNQAPIVTPEGVPATTGVSLTFTVTISAADPVNYALSGAPAGMSIAKSGIVSWPSPVAGTYNVKITAQDTVNGLIGQGTYAISVSPPQPPVVQGGTITGRAQIPLSFVATSTDTRPITWTLSGAPSGMTIGSGGAVGWPSPVQGTYQVKAIARDTATGLSGQATYTINITSAWPPSVMSTSVVESSLKPLSFTVFAADPNPLRFSLSGAPAGMTIASPSALVSWPSPVAGKYTVVITATDQVTGLSGQGTYQITVIAEPGPVITATSMNGVVGKAFNATITFTDKGGAIVGGSIANYPPGMNIGGSMTSFTLNWPAPIAGTYSIVVQATDSYGLMATLPLTITIAAH